MPNESASKPKRLAIVVREAGEPEWKGTAPLSSDDGAALEASQASNVSSSFDVQVCVPAVMPWALVALAMIPLASIPQACEGF